MKKKMICLAAMIALVATPVFAGTGPQNVKNTPHNLGNTTPDLTIRQVYATIGESEVCVFCHTPHGGTLDAPLWNRDLSSLAGAGKFDHYTSTTVSSALSSTTRAVNPESLTCLSCHDGSIGTGDVINKAANVTYKNNSIVTGANFNPSARIGSSRAKMMANDATTFDLRDDHPISFSYSASLAAKPGTLHDVVDVENKELVLYGAAENLECATCHDPHVDYITDATYDPFLAIPNAGSDLCLSCHIK